MNRTKFINEFNSFCSEDQIKNLAETSKVALFTTYCQIMISNPKTQKPTNNTSTHATRNNGKCTLKQANLLKQLISSNHIDSNIDINNLTIKDASKLIEQGLSNQKSGVTVTKENDDSEEFAGSYDHGSLFE